MKTITIQRLTLRNFKGCESLELDLGGKNAAIYGDNATGKTTVYDALTWLLFGKDSRGSAEQETIKPLDGTGAVKDHQAVTTVEAVLTVCEDVTGPSSAARSCYTVTLRKEMQESWTTRRGSSTQVYDGNDFRYFWDGVPLKKSEYTRRVGELVEEDVFKMLTSVSAFAFDLPWRKRREILYDLSGVQAMSDRALLQEAAKGAADGGQIDRATGEAFEQLAEQICGGMTLDELKRVLLARKKGLIGTRDQTPARIDELSRQRDGLSLLDFEGAARKRQEAQAELASLQEQLRTFQNGESTPELEAAMQDVRGKLGELDLRLLSWKQKRSQSRADIVWKLQAAKRRKADAEAAIVREIRENRARLEDLEHRNTMWRRKQEAEQPDAEALRREAVDLERSVGYWNNLAQQQEKMAADADANLETARKKWSIISQESFSGGTCPTCGQELPFELMQEARAKFETEKAKKLNEIREDAERFKTYSSKRREDAKTSRVEADVKRQDLEAVRKKLDIALEAPEKILDLEGYAEQKAALETKLAALNQTGPDPALAEEIRHIEEELTAHDAVTEFPGYGEEKAALEQEKARVKGEIDKLLEHSAEQMDALNERLEAATNRYNEADAIAQRKPILDYAEKRIGELREAQKKAETELEQIDATIWAMETFVRWKTRFIEDSINGLFRLVTFRLFRELASGGLEERCDVVVDGVPYAAINNGARINAGLDIISRLGEHYGVRVPLFIDNAESVTRLEDAGTQVIRLVVSEQDKRLRVEV